MPTYALLPAFNLTEGLSCLCIIRAWDVARYLHILMRLNFSEQALRPRITAKTELEAMAPPHGAAKPSLASEDLTMRRMAV